MVKHNGKGMTISFGSDKDGWTKLDDMSLVDVRRDYDYIDVTPFDSDYRQFIKMNEPLTVTMTFQNTSAFDRMYDTWRGWWLDPITDALERWKPSRAWRLAGYAALLVMLAGLVIALYG